MIKIFFPIPLIHSPFAISMNFFNEQGIVAVDHPENCDILIAESILHLESYRLKYGSSKKYLIWTDEPTYDLSFQNLIKGINGLPDLHIMNCYTGDIHVKNYYFGIVWERINQILEPLTESNFQKLENKKVVALMTYRGEEEYWSLDEKHRELYLAYLRTQIALEGHLLNKLDIYGRGWPEGVAVEDSRDDWSPRKMEILAKYNFNLCFENKNIDYYCTEKIWDSITGGCLPIYYGKGNKIYEDFPKNSFLDYSEFEKPSELFEYIDRMEVGEFRERMNRCIEVNNHFFQNRGTYSKCYLDRIDRIVKKLEFIQNYR